MSCPDIGIGETIEPGDSLNQTLWWSGFTDVNRACPPDGPATIAAFAAYVETLAIANGRAEIPWYDPRRNVWEVGIMPWYETEPTLLGMRSIGGRTLDQWQLEVTGAG